MFRRSKKLVLPVVFLFIWQAATCQQRTNFNLQQDATPLFKTSADSAAYFSNQTAMLQYNPLASKRMRMDSLWNVQQNILKNGILRWQYTSRTRPLYSFRHQLPTNPAEIKN
jgi:hypothetical protein